MNENDTVVLTDKGRSATQTKGGKGLVRGMKNGRPLKVVIKLRTKKKSYRKARRSGRR